MKPKEPQQKQKVDLTEKQIKMINSWILYMNEEVIVLNKPPGISVQGGDPQEKFNIDAMLDALKFDYKETPKLVHRLDKSVSGNLVIARNRKGVVRMFEWFKDRDTLKKAYWAIVVGKPNPTFGRIKMRLEKRDKMYPVQDQNSKEGTLSITEYKLLDSSQVVSLLQLYPITGRKHQLRVHCSTGLGCEIIGDLKYGTGIYDFMPEFDEWDQIYLHSREVSLPYIENNKRVVVVAPLYDNFQKMMKKFGFYEKHYPQSLQ